MCKVISTSGLHNGMPIAKVASNYDEGARLPVRYHRDRKEIRPPTLVERLRAKRFAEGKETVRCRSHTGTKYVGPCVKCAQSRKRMRDVVKMMKANEELS